jgi:hypothetical protein
VGVLTKYWMKQKVKASETKLSEVSREIKNKRFLKT